MKKLLISIAIIIGGAIIAIPLVTRVIGPKMIFVSAPTGVPIGEYDFPRPEKSLLAVDIAIPIVTMNEIANAKVPTRFEGIEQKNIHKRVKNGGLAWAFERGPIHFSNNGSELVAGAQIKGAARIRGDIDAKLIQIPLDSTIEIGGIAGGALAPTLDQKWNLDPRLTPSINLSEAALSLGGIGRLDISSILGGTISQFIQKQMGQFVPALRKELNFRSEINTLWQEAYLTEKISEEPEVWLKVTPTKVRFAPVDYSDPDQISLNIGIESTTFLATHDPGKQRPKRIPDCRPVDEPFTTDLRLPVIVTVAELNKALEKQQFALKTGIGTRIDISEMEASIAQEGLINLKLNLEAEKNRFGQGIAGEIWIEGRPVIDLEAQTLGFADLALTVETEDKLSSTAAWLMEGILLKTLQSQLQIDLNDYQEEISEEVRKALDAADLPSGIDLSIDDLTITLADVYTISRRAPKEPDAPGLVIVIGATGRLETEINQLIVE